MQLLIHVGILNMLKKLDDVRANYENELYHRNMAWVAFNKYCYKIAWTVIYDRGTASSEFIWGNEKVSIAIVTKQNIFTEMWFLIFSIFSIYIGVT